MRTAGAAGPVVVSNCPRRMRRTGLTVALIVGVLIVLAVVLGVPAWLVTVVGVIGFGVAAIVGHRLVGNVFAGLTLLLARPYNPGEQLRLYVPGLGAVLVAEIVRVGLVRSTLVAPSGLLVVPNSLLLRAAPPGSGT